jgi:SPX domain protein involved in polyphosphate accumulation
LAWGSELTPESRFEYKYVIDIRKALSVRRQIAPFFSKDSISRAAEGGKYLVRSLYFDTRGFSAYVEKMIGETYRNKLRVRSYWRDPKAALFVNVEQKGKIASRVFKSVTRVDPDEWHNFQKFGTWRSDDANLGDFERQIRRGGLVPTTLVEYRREAFKSKDESQVRLTFDTSLKYADSRCLFSDTATLRRDLSYKTILEIKTKTDDVPWLNRLVRSLDIGAEPNSKYTDSIEHTQKALWV